MLRKLSCLVLISSVLLFALTGCHRTEKVVGNGNKQSVARNVEAFQKISLAGNYDVIIVGGMPQYVALTADSNVLNYLTTTVKNKTLEVGIQPNVSLSTKEAPFVQINVPQLQEITITGSGRINASKIVADTLTIRVSGSGHFNVSGTANKVVIEANGSSIVNTSDLVAKQVDINLNGSGRVSAHADEQLNVNLSGTGLVEYYGAPSKVSQNINGNGRIIGISSNAQENPS
jgi:hypothetical protein